VQRIRGDEGNGDGTVGRRRARLVGGRIEAREDLVLIGCGERRIVVAGIGILWRSRGGRRHGGEHHGRPGIGVGCEGRGGGRDLFGLPPITPRDYRRGIGCCTAVIRAVRGRDFGTRGGIDFLDDDRELGTLALGFVGGQRAVDLAKDRVR
jgi:hypothetical protein